MSADKMPPPPEREAEFSVNDSGRWTEATKGTPMWTEDSLHAYARAYAAEQTRELVDALELADMELERCHYHQDGPKRKHIRALIAKHKEQS